MNILTYIWNDISKDLYEALAELGYNVKPVVHQTTDYDVDEFLSDLLTREIAAGKYDYIISYNFFPVISDIASKYDIKYISWIYDNPNLTLFSKKVFNDVNYIFAFDYTIYEWLISVGCRHVFHMPLAAACNRLDSFLGKPSPDATTAMQNDVCFIGGMYNNTPLDQVDYLPDYISGYLDGLMNSQLNLQGINLADELINADWVSELKKYISFEFPDNYIDPSKTVLCDIINKKVANLERIFLLEEISRNYSLTIYSNSAENLPVTARYMGYADYFTTMPRAFRHSKINLNITMRSIISGIPLRCIDVMASGGFLISNYQPELAEFFEHGKECIMYQNIDELLHYIDYYLSHDEERQAIAYNGYLKVHEYFNYESKLPAIFKLCET